MSVHSIPGTVALVTGANRGIGRAIAEALLERGAAKVYAAARRVSTLEDLARRYGARVVPLALDVTDAGQVAKAAGEAKDVDLVVNNAGVVAGAPGTQLIDAALLEAARTELEVNYLGTLRVIQAFAPILAARGGGTVVNIASVASLANFPPFPTYSASKAALHSLTQAARALLAGQGTKVLGVYPGPVDTDMAEPIQVEKASPRDVAHAILDGIERGTEEIFPDPMAASFGSQYLAGPKELERQVAAFGS